MVECVRKKPLGEMCEMSARKKRGKIRRKLSKFFNHFLSRRRLSSDWNQRDYDDDDDDDGVELMISVETILSVFLS